MPPPVGDQGGGRLSSRLNPRFKIEAALSPSAAVSPPDGSPPSSIDRDGDPTPFDLSGLYDRQNSNEQCEHGVYRGQVVEE